MVEIVFSLNQVITKIQGNLKEPFKNVIDRYIQKSSMNSGSSMVETAQKIMLLYG